MRVITTIGLVLTFAGAAHAEVPGAVALLPLDADQRLEIYGQPVASEVARVLVAGGIDVVIVGPKMAVPERARLIVDGTIKAGKGDAVTLSVRIRDPQGGAIVDTLVVTAASLNAIDHAAEELSGKVLPTIKARLAALEPPKDDVQVVVKRPVAPAAAPAKPMLFAVSIDSDADGGLEPLRDALPGELAAWAQRHHHEAKVADAKELSAKGAPKVVLAANANLAVWCELRAFETETLDGVPMGRAKLRVRIADGSHIVFNRIVITDTVVGDRNLAADKLAARIAREVLAIVEPHVRRGVSGWR